MRRGEASEWILDGSSQRDEDATMARRSMSREVVVGLLVTAALGGVLVLLVLAGGGPGFLSSHRTIDVTFRDGQGLRAGCAVRVAGIDAGRVVSVDLDEAEESLVARVRLAVPANLVSKLKQDVKITIQPSLTGQTRVNIVSAGKSSVGLSPGKVVQGVESSFFDPILEQVGLGPVERGHISHTVAELRATVDATSPKIREIVGTLQDTADGLHASTEAARPRIEATAAQAELLTRRLATVTPVIESALTRVESASAQADRFLTENRAGLGAIIASVRDLTATMQDMTVKNRARVEQMLVNLDGTRSRADRVFYDADLLLAQSLQIVSKNRADIERTVSNVRDATDWADKLVQKLYANPFVLSPLYKPTPEDLRVQVVYDSAHVFTKGAQELTDAIKRLESMQAQATSPAQRQQVEQLRLGVIATTENLTETSHLLAESLKRQGAPATRRR
jgi:phospholipid/cholesterol/gamma-HCH transport system substrate-binding protein